MNFSYNAYCQFPFCTDAAQLSSIVCEMCMWTDKCVPKQEKHLIQLYIHLYTAYNSKHTCWRFPHIKLKSVSPGSALKKAKYDRYQISHWINFTTATVAANTPKALRIDDMVLKALLKPAQENKIFIIFFLKWFVHVYLWDSGSLSFTYTHKVKRVLK